MVQLLTVEEVSEKYNAINTLFLTIILNRKYTEVFIYIHWKYTLKELHGVPGWLSW